jgi:hypothetical protein
LIFNGCLGVEEPFENIFNILQIIVGVTSLQLRFGKSVESQHVRTRIGNLKFIFISRIKPSEVFLIILFSNFGTNLIFAKIESFPSQFPRKEILRHFEPKILKLIRSDVYEEILVSIRSLEDLIEWIRTGSFI